MSVSPQNANIVVSGANAELRIGEAGSLVQNGAASAGGMNLTIQSGASLVVDGGGAYSGFGEIGGGLNETVKIEPLGALLVVNDSTQPGTLPINPSLSMSDIATLGLSIFPTLGLSDVLVTKGDLTLGNLTTLDLSIVGTDTTLPLGFKLLLVDYSDTNSFTGRFDLPYRDGSIFDLGANEFQILCVGSAPPPGVAWWGKTHHPWSDSHHPPGAIRSRGSPRRAAAGGAVPAFSRGYSQSDDSVIFGTRSAGKSQ